MGLGLSVMPLFATATREADPADAGATGAAANTAQQIGASAGTAVLNTIAAIATASYVGSHHGLTGAVDAGHVPVDGVLARHEPPADVLESLLRDGP